MVTLYIKRKAFHFSTCYLYRILFLWCTLVIVGLECKLLWFRNQKEEKNVQQRSDATTTTTNSQYEVHSLVEKVGKAIYRWLNRPKFKFYMLMTIGHFNEENTILIVSSLCNAFYAILILIGFLILPRERMLIIAALTLYIGPVIILLGLGIGLLIIGCFAFYPVYSVLIIWIWFFFTSQIAQIIGKYLGLDTDDDGNVNILDLLYYCSTTRWGKTIGLHKLHSTIMTYTTKTNPFEEIIQRLHQIDQKLSNDENNVTKQKQPTH